MTTSQHSTDLRRFANLTSKGRAISSGRSPPASYICCNEGRLRDDGCPSCRVRRVPRDAHPAYSEARCRETLTAACSDDRLREALTPACSEGRLRDRHTCSAAGSASVASSLASVN